MPRLVLISDTHNRNLSKMNIPDGDILVHAGDATSMGTVREIIEFNKQLGKLPHAHKIFIAGNHDWLFEKDHNLAKSIMTNATYLQNSGTVKMGLQFWGSPATPEFFNWAFNYDRGGDLKRIWDQIPGNLDVLLTHGPPAGIGDRLVNGDQVGCYDLLQAVRDKVPRLHVFGHIHCAAGDYGTSFGTRFVNASICNEQYQAVNTPIVVDL